MSGNNSNKLVRSLQKLPENKRCFNCEVLGTNFIVPALNIFVCTDCSGLHMKCGQRVKSVSLGNYTPEEAKALQDGGNERAARIYLAKWNPNTSLQKPIDKKPPRVEEWIRTVFGSKQYYSEEAAREIAVHAVVEDKPLKQGMKLPLPAPSFRAAPVPVPEPQPEPEPEPTPTPAPVSVPKVAEVSLLDFGNSPVKATAPNDAWGAFDTAPGVSTTATHSTSSEAFDPFGSFGGAPMPSSSMSTQSARDPFSVSTTSSVVPSTTSFDPFGNSSQPFQSAPPTASTAATSVFDPFSTGGAPSGFGSGSNGPSAFNPAAAPGSWTPAFNTAPATSSAAAILNSSQENGFGLDVFQNMPPPSSEGRAVSNASSSFADFGAFPGQTSQPGTPATATSQSAAKQGPSELPSDLFSDNAFSAAFPTSPAAGSFGMATRGLGHPSQPAPVVGTLHGNGLGPSLAAFPGMGPVQGGFGGMAPGSFGAVNSGQGAGNPGQGGLGGASLGQGGFGGAVPGQPGFGAALGSQFGPRPAGGFINQPPFGGAGSAGPLGGMGPAGQFGGMRPGSQMGGIGPGGQMGGMGPGSQVGGMGPGSQFAAMGSQYGAMGPAGAAGAPGQFGSAMGQAGQFGGMGPGGQFNSSMGPGFGGPQHGLGFNFAQGMGGAGGMGNGMGGPGADPFGGLNSFGPGPGNNLGAGGNFTAAAGVTTPVKKQDEMAFADLVGDFKKALPAPTPSYGLASGVLGGPTGGLGFGPGLNSGIGGGAYGGMGGFSGFGGMSMQPAGGFGAGPAGMATNSGNPFA